jgi:hypothetical protein
MGPSHSGEGGAAHAWLKNFLLVASFNYFACGWEKNNLTADNTTSYYLSEYHLVEIHRYSKVEITRGQFLWCF